MKNLPPIYRDAKKLVAATEQVVRGFARYHRYTLGTELRQQSMVILQLTYRGVRDRNRQQEWVGKLVWAIDDYKLGLQMAKELAALQSFSQYEQLARQAANLGRQCGGWYKSLAPSRAESARPSNSHSGASR